VQEASLGEEGQAAMDGSITCPQLSGDPVLRQAVSLTLDMGENLLASEVFDGVGTRYYSHSLPEIPLQIN
jgi:hypothetical protein